MVFGATSRSEQSLAQPARSRRVRHRHRVLVLSALVGYSPRAGSVLTQSGTEVIGVSREDDAHSVQLASAEECLFCAIARGSSPAAIVRADRTTVAFMSREPATPGHVLVIPRSHSRNLFDIQPRDLRALFVAAAEVARWQRSRLRCSGVSLYQANEAAGFQTVFHTHVHVVPRYVGDAVSRAWQASARPLEELEETARRLRGPRDLGHAKGGAGAHDADDSAEHLPLSMVLVGDPAAIAANPQAWLIYARTLTLAADALWDYILAEFMPRSFGRRQSREDSSIRVQLVSVYMMLASFALEVLAKAAIIRSEPDRVTDSGVKPWRQLGHDVPSLLSLANIELSETEADLATRLSTFGQWGGRYPVPMKFVNTVERHFKRTDPDTFNELVRRLSSEPAS